MLRVWPASGSVPVAEIEKVDPSATVVEPGALITGCVFGCAAAATPSASVKSPVLQKLAGSANTYVFGKLNASHSVPNPVPNPNGLMGCAPRANSTLGLLPAAGVTEIVPSVNRFGGSNPEARPKLISTCVEVAGEEPRSTYAGFAEENAPQVTVPPTAVSVMVYDPRSSGFAVAMFPQSAAVWELHV